MALERMLSWLSSPGSEKVESKEKGRERNLDLHTHTMYSTYTMYIHTMLDLLAKLGHTVICRQCQDRGSIEVNVYRKRETYRKNVIYCI